MKRFQLFSIILAAALLVGTMSAQTPKWVSTEVQKRVAVLEEFTGMYCQWCPAGHKLANDIAKKHPGQFIAINNHCGYYAQPGSGDPDLRTLEGDTIMNQAGVQGFPQGSINRSTTPWAMNRDLWQAAAENIMNQNSVVNVYVNPEYNSTKHELTVEVEYYYTDDSPASQNYLTVMLLQNEIIAYQTLGSTHNPEYATSDGLYRHMHALRGVISNGGTWGDPITNTKKGSYECRKYTVTIPDYINSVLVEHYNLEVVAFISESKANIYTGHKAVVEIPEEVRTDLTIEDLTEYPAGYKFETINPKIKVTNNSDLSVTNFDVSFVIAHTQMNYSKTDTYKGTLNKGESAVFEFPAINREDFKAGSRYIPQTRIANILKDSIGLVDMNLKDNSTAVSKIGFFDNAFEEIELSFENASGSAAIPPHTVIDQSYNSAFSISGGINGAKNTKAAVYYYLLAEYGVANKPGYIMFGELICKDNPNKVLSYYYAYSDGKRGGTAPKIVTEISKDWGKSWTRISEITCVETGQPANVNSAYIPKSGEYKVVQVDLSPYLQDNCLVRVGGVPGTGGNLMWIDEISIKNSTESIAEDINLSIYPNPTTNILYINNNDLLGEEYEIYDLSGKLILRANNNTNEINVESLSTGTYSLKIKGSVFNFIKK
ncbi:MAG: Omp28-related outer membrane protein [Bacteroidetes bacterium]|nr:Omp28-related outer membrane protein [Bacteroidota bacterium]